MMIVQICPEIGAGTGVGGVAADLEAAWQRAGVETRRFTLADAGGGWLPPASTSVPGRLALLARVVWFSTVGSVRARRYCRSVPGAVSLCHNDALAGDAYVNHGILQVAMRDRGRARWRLLRNPMHLFVVARDRYRFRSRTHRLVINLSSTEDRLLAEVHPRLAPATAVVGNGVDLDRFRPPTDEQRAAARERFGYAARDRVVLFVGNEHDRKGLPLVLDALGRTDGARLLVVGGDAPMVSAARHRVDRLGVADRCRFVGPVADVRDALHAADVFCLPSAYESFGLVYLEALAAGLPVVATPVGVVPDIVTPENGRIIPAEAAAVAEALDSVLTLDRRSAARAARATAEQWSWDAVAARYLELLRAARPVDEEPEVTT